MDIEGSWNQRNGLKCNILIEKVKEKSGSREKTISKRLKGYLKTDSTKQVGWHFKQIYLGS